MMQDDAGLVEVMARARWEAYRKIPANAETPEWDDSLMPEYTRDKERSYARAALAAIEAAGFKVVPVEPTELVEACREAAETFVKYAAMHRAKNTVEGEQKAAANDYMARKMRAALAGRG